MPTTSADIQGTATAALEAENSQGVAKDTVADSTKVVATPVELPYHVSMLTSIKQDALDFAHKLHAAKGTSELETIITDAEKVFKFLTKDLGKLAVKLEDEYKKNFEKSANK